MLVVPNAAQLTWVRVVVCSFILGLECPQLLECSEQGDYCMARHPVLVG